MASTVSVDTKTLKTLSRILSRLDELTSEIKTIKAKIFEEEPSYGSDEWWKKETKEAEEEFKKGKGIRFETAKDAIKWLNS